MTGKIAMLGLASVIALPLLGAEPEGSGVQTAGFGDSPPTRRNPADIGNQLRKDDAVKESAFRFPRFDADGLDQYAIEAYYRIQLTPRLSITPDVQLIVDPALNPDDSTIGYFGIRARLAL